MRVFDVVRAAQRVNAAAWHVHDFYMLPFARRWALKNKKKFIYDQHEFYDLYYQSRLPAFIRSTGLVPRWVNSFQLRMVAGAGAANVVHPGMSALYEDRGVRVSVTPNFPVVDPVAVLGLPSWLVRSRQVIHIGTLSEPYGMDLLQDIALVLERTNSGITIDAVSRFPSDSIRDRFYERRRALGGLPQLRLIDSVSSQQLIETLGDYRVALSMIDESGQNSVAVPTKLYEHTIAGVVSVVSARAAQIGYIEAIGVGTVVGSNDPEEWAASIANALRPKEPEEVVQRIRRARDVALQTATWDEVGVRLEGLLRAVAEQDR